MKKFLIVFFLTSVIVSQSFGSVFHLSHLSRANCGNNESISWDVSEPHLLWINSEHFDATTSTKLHYIIYGWDYTRRAAAIHWGEGRGGWGVHGWHWMKDSVNSRPYLAQDEYVIDCSFGGDDGSKHYKNFNY